MPREIQFATPYFTLVRQAGLLRLTGQSLPRGRMLPVMPGFDRGLSRGAGISDVDNSGGIYLKDGRFSPRPLDGAVRVPGGSILGSVAFFDGCGTLLPDRPTVSLGRYKWWDQEGHVSSTIEIKKSPFRNNRLLVIERRMDGTGLNDDRSAYVYNLAFEGRSRLLSDIGDLSRIRSIRVTKAGVFVEHEQPSEGTIKSFTVISTYPARYFVDNFGLPLLSNRSANMGCEEDLFQDELGTEWTKRFLPRMDFFGDFEGQRLKLIVHKVRSYEIDMPPELKDSGNEFRIFPSLAVSAVRMSGSKEWVPLTLKRPLSHLETIDLEHSKISKGEVLSCIGPQSRVGNAGEVSGMYIRDLVFYELLNRYKATNGKFMGIQSGRTHLMPWHLIFDPMIADIMPTENPYLIKLSNYGGVLWSPGVSEDTQMDKYMRILGPKMWIVNQRIALMTAEKLLGKYDTQNTSRYNFSEMLFVIPFQLAMLDFINSFTGRNPSDFWTLGASMELLAGRTWYKVGLAKTVEMEACPLFNGSLGYAICYPVDMPVFLSVWAARTLASSFNYALMLKGIGLRGFTDGFIMNPSIENSFYTGYLGKAYTQHVYMNQFGTFSPTVAGSDADIPEANWKAMHLFAGQAAVTLGIASASLLSGGFSQLGSLSGFGVNANLFFGSYSLLQLMVTLNVMKKFSRDMKKTVYASAADLDKEKPGIAALLSDAREQAQREIAGMSFRDGFLLLERLELSLKLQLAAMDDNFMPRVSLSDRYRDIDNGLLDAYISVQVKLLLKAQDILLRDPGNIDARLAVARLQRISYDAEAGGLAREIHRDAGLLPRLNSDAFHYGANKPR